MKRTTSTAAVAIVTLLLNIAFIAPASAAGRTGKYKSNGAFAQAYGYDATGCRWFYLYVAKGGTTAAPQTYLYYDIYDSCAGAWSWGNGTIPNVDFKVGSRSITLKTTPANASGFFTEGESLAISLTFTPDRVYSVTWSGHSRTEYHGHVVQRHGSGTQGTAAITGTVGGMALGTVSAESGTSREHYMEFDRGTR
jgi:hypothetical protein